MATYGAISATSTGILGLLESAAATEPDFAVGGTLAGTSFALYGSADLQQPMGDPMKVSLYLYHVAVNTTRRNLSPRTDVNGQRRKPAIPLDLHYLLIAWAKNPEMQQRLLGWCVRIIQDTPTLPASVLNQHAPPPPVFRPDETVELIWETLSREDVFDIWGVARANQQPSAAYVARIVEIESTAPMDAQPLAQTREFIYGEVPAS